MDAKELRIGNWVHHNNTEWSYRNEDGVISNYGKFNQDCFQWEDRDFYAVSECTMSYTAIEPIELTEEWLIGSGFSQLDKYTFIKNGIFIHKRKVGFMLKVSSKKIQIKYYHKLQNIIYALTGEELKLKQS